MKVVLQRVNRSSVSIEGTTIAEIGIGLLCYVSYAPSDNDETMKWVSAKIADLRIFPGLDGKDRFDRSVREIDGSSLVVSNFTLHGDCRKGRRPDFMNAATPQVARGMHHRFIEILKETGVSVQDGRFGAHMLVESVNDGPVTFIFEKE